MSDKSVKILKNVFISTGGNQLKLVDIYFSDIIEYYLYLIVFSGARTLD